MVDRVSSSMMTLGLTSASNAIEEYDASNLSDDEKTTLIEVLSQYDAETLNDTDAAEIAQALSDAGIGFEEEGLADVFADLGFDQSLFDLIHASYDALSSVQDEDLAGYLNEMIEAKLADSGDSELTDVQIDELKSNISELFGNDDGSSLLDIVV